MGKLSMRKQKSAKRLKDFQQRRRILLLWRRALHKAVRSLRFDRLWRVHNAWFATLSASTDAVGPPASETERMDEDRGTKRAAEPAEQTAGTKPAEQPSQSLEGGPPSGDGLNPSAQEFVPGWQVAGVELMQSDAASEMVAAGRRVRRREVVLGKELRRVRKATREAEEAAAAANAAKHNAQALARAAELRSAVPRPLGISPRPPSC